MCIIDRFYISGTGLIMNIVLDPLFIFGFGWGTVGAALATWPVSYTHLSATTVVTTFPSLSVVTFNTSSWRVMLPSACFTARAVSTGAFNPYSG